MKDLDPLVFLAVFQEMLGPLLWVLIGLAVVGLAAFLFVLLRDRKFMLRRFIYAEAAGFAGAVAAVAIMWSVTNSGLSDAGGPIDWLLILTIFVAGWAGALVLYYAAAGLITKRGEA
jgi:hypothetical protein